MRKTREKRLSQDCQVFTIKIDVSSLKKEQAEAIKMQFVESYDDHTKSTEAPGETEEEEAAPEEEGKPTIASNEKEAKGEEEAAPKGGEAGGKEAAPSAEDLKKELSK